MKRYLIHGAITVALLAGISVAEQREQRPVTKASLAKSLLTQADKAEKAGLTREATIILKAASQVMSE